MFDVENVKFGGDIPAIAVPIMEADEEAILANVRLAIDTADLIELRADAFAGIHDTRRILALLSDVRDIFDGPILFTLRTEREGGLFTADTEEYQDILRIAVSSGCIDLIDIELASELTEEAEAYGFTTAAMLAEEAHEFGVRVVMSQHDFHSTPRRSTIYETLLKMRDEGADIAKGAYMPECAEDVNEVLSAGLRAKQELGIPTILISMGEYGSLTRTHGEVIGSAVTFAGLAGKTSAPGQIEADSLRKILSDVHEGLQQAERLFLIGFMGTGKSSVARAISARSGLPYVEMDEKIEATQSMPISRIFAEYGETYFRDLESSFIASLSEEAECVISCGGGAVLRAENVVRMKPLGKIILLTAEPETLYERMMNEAEKRPLLAGRFSPEGIAGLAGERREYYMEAQDHIVATDGRTVTEIADEIIELWR